MDFEIPPRIGKVKLISLPLSNNRLKNILSYFCKPEINYDVCPMTAHSYATVCRNRN